MRIKILRTAIDMSNFWKPRRKWKDSTKTRSSKCARVMNSKWIEEDRIIETSKRLILRDSMSFKVKKMKNPENLKKG